MKLDSGIGHRARIGLIALPDDQTIEYELRMIFDLPGGGLFWKPAAMRPPKLPRIP